MEINTFYKNTVPDNPENTVLGYWSEFGEFISRDEYTKRLYEPEGQIIVVKSFVLLLGHGEIFSSFCRRVAREAYDYFTEENYYGRSNKNVG